MVELFILFVECVRYIKNMRSTFRMSFELIDNDQEILLLN